MKWATGKWRTIETARIVLLVFAAFIVCAFWTETAWAITNEPPYRSPFDAKYSPDGTKVAVSDRTAGKLVLVDVARAKIAQEIVVAGEPTGVAWEPHGTRVFVSAHASGTVAEVDALNGRILRRIQVGPGPMGLAVAAKKKLLIVCNHFGDDVSIVDMDSGHEERRVAVIRQPVFVAVTPDESLAVVSNLLPLGDATDPQTAACVTLIDLKELKKVADIRLPGGSSSCRQVAVSPDGRWAYVVHTIGRTQQATIEIGNGWINVNALSILDLKKQTLAATVLLDRMNEGAADPWGLVLSPDGKTIWISLAGIHQLARIDREGLHNSLEGKPSSARADRRSYLITSSDANVGMAPNPKDQSLPSLDFSSLYLAGLISRTHLVGFGPRGLAVSPDGKTLAVPMYFSGKLLLLDAASGDTTATVSLGPEPKMDEAREGEMIFHDASRCLGHWLSCASCHPDGRVDGLNWDLLNDGIGNPKNVRSLLYAHRTPPMMTLGIRSNMEVAVEAGFRYIEFHDPTKEETKAVQEYIRSLQPVRSPHLLRNGELSPSATRGRRVFSGKAGCAICHSGPLFTNLQTYDIGTTVGPDKGKRVITPTLIELWRTAPYLHTGAAVTLREVFMKFNKIDQHGHTSNLSPKELDDLVEFLLSL
jgi:DNA-binding beta-propeller fold protein YncE